MFSKLGIRLPFFVFECAILRALNMALTQLHPNSWAFVKAFELLCEDMEREPPLTDKVGWNFLSSRPKRKLMKPYCENYKRFKDHLFRVPVEQKGPNLLLGYSIKDITSLKTHSRFTSPAVVAEASPLSVVGPAEIVTQVVEVDSIEESPKVAPEKVDGTVSKQAIGEGVLHDEERPSK
ncbi:hypothetical protein CR513_62187, partial [Mucuna pruriens]